MTRADYSDLKGLADDFLEDAKYYKDMARETENIATRSRCSGRSSAFNRAAREILDFLDAHGIEENDRAEDDGR